MLAEWELVRSNEDLARLSFMLTQTVGMLILRPTLGKDAAY